MTVVMHFINGAQVANSSNRTGKVFNPALGQVIREVALAETKDAKAAIQAAQDAFPSWRDTSLTKRQQIMFNFREILNASKEECIAIEGQAIGRACRIGQKNKINIIRILIEDTIEEEIYKKNYNENVIIEFKNDNILLNELMPNTMVI